jgi:hypothetical protein
MPVRYTPPRADELLPVPGVVLGTAAAKLKNWQRDDLLLAVFAADTAAAGVFTQNRFCAAPVIVCRRHLGTPGASSAGRQLQCQPHGARASPRRGHGAAGVGWLRRSRATRPV